MEAFDFDLFTIGAGSGGVASSRRAGAYGAKVAICEEARVGGTCVLRGCVPKKLLVYGAHFQDEIKDAAGFGWTIGNASHDYAALVEAKDRELDRLNGIYLRLLEGSKVQLIEGRAKLVDAHTVEVANKRYTARNILVATGSWPHMPNTPGIEHAISSNEALDLKALPPRVVVVGGGYIAVEFAGIFNTLGSNVTVVMRGPQILRGFDDEVRGFLAGEMTKRGVKLVPGAEITVITRIDPKPHPVAPTTVPVRSLLVTLSNGTKIEADVVLYATGRTPNTRGIGLEQAGVQLDGQGAIVVDSFSRTTQPSVFAVGDCTNRVNLTPVAIAEGRAVIETLFRDNPTEIDHALVPSAVFSQPPLSCVGLNEADARRAGPVDIYVSTFRPMKHTLSGRDERTFMKLVVDRATQKVVGAHMAGADAPEIIQGVAIALRCGATKADFDRTIGIHPTAAEEFVTMREPRKDPP